MRTIFGSPEVLHQVQTPPADLQTCNTNHAHPTVYGNATLFQSTYALQFGVGVESKEAEDSKTCWLRFCLHEGLDEI